MRSPDSSITILNPWSAHKVQAFSEVLFIRLILRLERDLSCGNDA
jgi:hypothetical protein